MPRRVVRHPLRWRSLSTPPRLLAGSFLLLIAAGTLGLRSLPGLYTGERLGWLDCLFTATSAVCVTGLVVVDTATYFTQAGQVGMTAALYGSIDIEGGRVRQGNFHDYRILRMPEMPEIDVHIVPSSAPPSGIGEPGVPPVAPAMANAKLALTGEPTYRLPFRQSKRSA